MIAAFRVAVLIVMAHDHETRFPAAGGGAGVELFELLPQENNNPVVSIRARS
jgi:hypothetical protein